jgi:hypothetical protein
MFAQLERLGDESLDDAELEREIKRGKAIREAADGIIATAKAETDRLQAIGEYQVKSGSKLLAASEEQKQIEGGQS